MFDRVLAAFSPDRDHGLPDDDLDGVWERQLAWAETLPEFVPYVPDSAPEPVDDVPASSFGDCAPSGWSALELDLDTADPARLTDTDLIEAMIGFDRVASWAAARQARLLAELDRRRPADQAPHTARTACVGSEFTPDEVGVALHLPRGTASALIDLACRLLSVLPDTHALWESGLINTAKARAVGDATCVLTDEHARKVEAQVLPQAPQQTLAQLKAALARAILAVDPDGADDRHRGARRDRRVVLTPDTDGMASLWALLTATDAAGAYAWLTRLAKGMGPDDARSMDTRRADILAALLNGRLVTDPDPDIDLTDDADPEPGGTDGTADAQADAAAGSTDAAVTDNDSTGTGTGTTAGRPIHPTTPGKPLIQIVIAHSTLIGADDQPAELVGHGPIPASLAREAAADAVWRRIVTDPLAGTVLDYGRTTYHPPAGLADHVRVRDVSCRFPGCRRKASDAELDHAHAWTDGGETSAANLHALCLHHHLLKHHAGWRITTHPDGRLTWTTPTGHRHTTTPHDYGPEPPLPPTVSLRISTLPPEGAPRDPDPGPPPF